MIFLIKPFCHMTKKSRQKFKYLENKKSFWGEIKKNFSSLVKSFQLPNCLRPDSAPLISFLIIRSVLLISFLIIRSALVSSAKRENVNVRDDFLMSFIYNRNRTGPYILPGGTPHEIYLFSEKTLPILTTYSLLLRYDWNHYIHSLLAHNFLVLWLRFCGQRLWQSHGKHYKQGCLCLGINNFCLDRTATVVDFFVIQTGVHNNFTFF